MTAVTEQIGNWVAEFSKQQPVEPWLQRLRETAFQRFSELGFPTTHDEEWRFTNVGAIARTAFRPASPVYDHHFPPSTKAITFLNGHLFDKSTDPPKDGVTVGSLLDADSAAAQHLARYASYDRNAFVALNTAFCGEGAFIRVPRGMVLEEPVDISYATGPGTDGAVTHPRTLVLVGPGAHCTIGEYYLGGEDPYFTNAVTEIVVGDGAVVDHYKVQLEGPRAFHIATMQVQLGRSANFSSHSISLGGALVRNDVGAVLSEGAEATLNGLYIVNGTQHIDNHTVIDHAKPHGTSHELYKGILDGKANAVFNGRIIVRKDAQKTDSKQTNKNLVLSDEAVINTKPELQILADDVRCTHGATIGQLDAESLFYMQSRGIGKSDARNLLTYAFAQDIVDRVKVQSLKDSLERILFEKFHEHAH